MSERAAHRARSRRSATARVAPVGRVGFDPRARPGRPLAASSSRRSTLRRPDLADQAPPGPATGAPVTTSRRAPSPSGPANSAAGRLPVPDHRLDGRVVLGHVGRVAHHQVRAAGQRRPAMRRTTSRGQTDVDRGPADPGQVGAAPRRAPPPRHRRPTPCPVRRRPARPPARGAMAPDPVPRSAMTSGDPGDRASRGRWPGPPRTSCSVSGRGIRTRRSTSRSSRRKAQCPSTYWSGSPARRRATMASSRATARSRGGLVEPEHPLRALQPAGLLAQPAGLGTRRRARSAVSTSSSRQVITAVGSGELAGPLVGHQRLDHLVQLARQHVLELVEREADAVVRDPVLLEVVGADLLAAPAPADLGPPLGRQLRGLLVLLGLEQAGPQHRHGPGPVLELAALVLHGHRDAASACG